MKGKIPAGMVRFVCKTHGAIIDTFPSAKVTCKCGKDATATEGEK